MQFGLFGGSVNRLGTARHHDRYLRDIASLELPGCFGMSESGHGSDVRSIRTQARYDADAQEFVLHTPDETARKDWIGSAARHARVAAVFAQLDVAGEAQGVHAFLVPIRSPRATSCQASRSRTAATRWGCRAWTTAGCACPPYVSRGRRCWIGTAR